MAKYVALLRGIGPSNPNMRNEKLRAVCEDLDYENVRTFISTGNVPFETSSSDVAGLEEVLESAWPEKLDFDSTTIIRSEADLWGLVELDPFDGREHNEETYLLVTFAKNPMAVEIDFPHQPPDKDYWVVAGTDRELFTVSDTTAGRTPDVMAWMDRQLGKEISSRTWLTVTRILKKMEG